MERNRKKSGVSRVIIIIAAVLAVLAAAVLVAALVKGGGTPDFSFFSGKAPAEATDIFYFDSGRSRVYADLDGGFAVASTTGLQVFDAEGNENVSSTFIFQSPAMASNGKYGAAFDVGGTTVCVFSSEELMWTANAENAIISCTVADNGYTALITGEGSYKTSVTVYDETGKATYKWYSAEGYTEAAYLAGGGTELCVASLCGSGSSVAFLRTDSEDKPEPVMLDGELALSVRQGGGGAVLLTAGGLWLVSGTEASCALDFENSTLGGCSLGDGFAALSLLYYNVGNQGRLVTVSYSGETLGEVETERELLSVSAKGDRVAALWSDGLTVYDKKLREIASVETDTGAAQAIMRSDGSVLVIASHSASVYDIG